MKASQGGYSLIEIAMATLLLSIGVLGMATMQINAKRLNYDAMQRSFATLLAHDIIERMRVNPNGIGHYVASELGGGSLDKSPSTDCAESICNSAQLAAYDLWQWEQVLGGATEINASGDYAGGLLNARACITHNDGVVTVAIAWRGLQDQGNPAASTCGEGLGLYGPNDELRRIMVSTTFISTRHP